MSEWKIVKLGDLMTESKIESCNPSALKRIRVKLNVKGVEHRPEKNETEGATKQYIRKAGQFIYGKQNFHKGAFGVIPKELDGFETSSDIPSFDVSEKCLPEWIYYFFKAGNKYLELEKLASGVGSKRISPQKIFEIKIPLPPIDDQKKIISKIINFEKQCDVIFSKNTFQRSHLNLLRQQILQDAISGKLTEYWRKINSDVEPASELLKRIKHEKETLIKEKKIKKEKLLSPLRLEEILFELPQGWQWVRLGNLKTLSEYGTSEKAYEDIAGFPVLAMGNINGGKVSLIAKKNLASKSSDLPRLLLRKKDVLFNRTNSWELVGKTGIFEGEDDKFTFASYLIRLRFLDDLISADYVNLYLNSRSFRETQIEPQIVQQCGQANFNGTKLSNALFPLPPLAEQKVIVTKVASLMNYCDQVEATMVHNKQNAVSLMQAFLAEAFKS